MPSSDQGASFGRYQFIPRTLVFVTREDQVLLLKGAPGKRLWAGRYNGIGGHVEQGEDVYSAAQRELLEETGLKVRELQLRGVITVDLSPERGVVIFVFTGEYTQGALKQSAEGALRWVSQDEFAGLHLVEDLYTLLPKILAMGPQERPFSAQYTYDRDDRLVVKFSKPN
jgi:8-oxo-dGTP diphosphatase